MKYLFILFVIVSTSCSSQHKEENKLWKTENYINETQILLTNDYLLGETTCSGASAFLIASKNNVPLLCTAKHLLGNAMGLNPEISTTDFDTKLGYWNAFPRNNKISNDTLKITKMVTNEINSTDIILLEIDTSKTSNIRVLKPRFSDLKKGEKLTIIGCEYSDISCHQKIYNAEMDEYENGLPLLKCEKTFSPGGFSGAPVIDEDGFVVGVVSSGGEFDGVLYISIAPLTKVKKWLE